MAGPVAGHGVPGEAGPGTVWLAVHSLGAVAPMVEGYFHPREGVSTPQEGFPPPREGYPGPSTVQDPVSSTVQDPVQYRTQYWPSTGPVLDPLITPLLDPLITPLLDPAIGQILTYGRVEGQTTGAVVKQRVLLLIPLFSTVFRRFTNPCCFPTAQRPVSGAKISCFGTKQLVLAQNQLFCTKTADLGPQERP